MKRKRDLLMLAGATICVLGLFYGLPQPKPTAPAPPSSATLRFRQAVQSATEVHLYNRIAETSGPHWGHAEFALLNARPVFQLRGRELNQFVQSLEINRWSVDNGPQVGAIYGGALAAEFYQGTKCLAHLRFLPGKARWYGPKGYIGEGQVTPQAWRDLEARLGT